MERWRRNTRRLNALLTLARRFMKVCEDLSTVCCCELTKREVEWLRVVLDEAHHCKSRTSKTAKAVYALNARRRWAVTGLKFYSSLKCRALAHGCIRNTHRKSAWRPLLTPVSLCSSPEEKFTHVIISKFLNFQPWSNFSFFRSYDNSPVIKFVFTHIPIKGLSHCLSLRGIRRPSKLSRSSWKASSCDERKICGITTEISLWNCLVKRFVRHAVVRRSLTVNRLSSKNSNSPP